MLVLLMLAEEMVMQPRTFLMAMIISSMFFTSFNAKLFRGNEIDRPALLALKEEITDGPLGVLSSWNKSVHFCEWFGVTCRRRYRRVISLDLSSSKLAGRLSSHIGNLSFLRILNLQDNSFRGYIPQELGFLQRLEQLNLGNNKFSGEIPPNISRCSNLQFLHLGDNNLTGKLPVELGFLAELETLTFQNNDIAGEIPSSFGNLSSLEIIMGHRNSLTGVIPDSFGQLPKVATFSFGENYLTGFIPSSMYNLSSLILFYLSFNQLEGNLPHDLGLLFPDIYFLAIAGNRFSGTIPATIRNASLLEVVEFGSNSFSGKVPSLVGLDNLIWLLFYENNLGNGENDDINFLSYLVNCSRLEVLEINDNKFGGFLPEYVSNFSTRLTQMALGWNQIQGKIPSGIGKLVSLEGLELDSNQLTGTIPSSLGVLPKLKVLNLNSNKLSGEVPTSLGNLTSLLRINMGSNELHGSIPASLGNWRNLLLMNLSANKLNGAIPRELMGISSLAIGLNLSGNSLTGSIPLEVGKLVNLGALDLSNNKLSGEIPATLGFCISLESLYLERNSLQGNIPESLCSLKAIQILNFSRNNLSGKIPEFLAGLRLLEYLNLSFNNFEGELPTQGVFKDASLVSVLENKKLCGGIAQLELPRCVSNEPKRHKSSTTTRIVIAVSSGLLLIGVILLFLFFVFHRCRKVKEIGVSTSSMEISFPRKTYGDLFKATDGFSSSNLIGTGGFGSVYKGIIHQGGTETAVAVKVLNLEQEGAMRSFVAECEALRGIRHRNLVKILTVCSSIDFSGNDFKALVYEFMENRSLDECLHQTWCLDFNRRLNIAVHVANAVDYLHNQCLHGIIHGDLKPSNVLLEADMTACVGDFGLSRLLPETSRDFSSNQASSAGFRGSIGYAAPEYAMRGEVTASSDIYSYGILLLEMFTGKRPTDEMFIDDLNICNFVTAALPDRVAEIIDPMILTEHEGTTRKSKFLESLILILKIGVSCAAELPRERMNISHVTTKLQRIRDELVYPFSRK